jgi:hypothetical protein
MKRLIFITISILLLCTRLLGQETIIVGEVYDASSGEAISNVNIFLQGTQEGTTTNAEGLFLLRTQQKKNTYNGR